MLLFIHYSVSSLWPVEYCIIKSLTVFVRSELALAATFKVYKLYYDPGVIPVI